MRLLTLLAVRFLRRYPVVAVVLFVVSRMRRRRAERPTVVRLRDGEELSVRAVGER